MQVESVPEHLCAPLRALVAAQLGLNFHPDRNADLWRGVSAAARELGFFETAEYVQQLISAAVTPQQLRVLADHLTVGETYFFREPATLKALVTHVLPELIRTRRDDMRRLRLWSAACSTGEEAYSLAMLVRQLLPDWRDWQINILGTDINSRALRKASAGVYGKWSFRACPPELRAQYFTQVGRDEYAIATDIKAMVRFEQVNLAKDAIPSSTTDTTAMDLILCRNLLIYFTPEHATELIAKLYASLSYDGWLAVSPSECSQQQFAEFETANFDGATLYRKVRNRRRPQPVVITARAVPRTPPTTQHVPPRTFAYPAANDAFIREKPPHSLASLARSLANEGRLSEALVWSKQWVTAEKLNAAAHYLHGTIAQELGDSDTARRSFDRCVYLQPDFVLGHFALGTLARRAGRQRESKRHFQNTLDVLQDLSSETVIPESDGLTAGRLAEMILSSAERHTTS